MNENVDAKCKCIKLCLQLETIGNLTVKVRGGKKEKTRQKKMKQWRKGKSDSKNENPGNDLGSFIV